MMNLNDVTSYQITNTFVHDIVSFFKKNFNNGFIRKPNRMDQIGAMRSNNHIIGLKNRDLLGQGQIFQENNPLKSILFSHE